MNLHRCLLILVQSHCTSLAPQPADAWLHPCRQSQSDRRSRSRQRSEKTEGKIKGPARNGPHCQSARGLGVARRLAADVPSLDAKPDGIEVFRVPSSTQVARLRWSMCHGLA